MTERDFGMWGLTVSFYFIFFVLWPTFGPVGEAENSVPHRMKRKNNGGLVVVCSASFLSSEYIVDL